ncbi:MAG: hypothetical protein K0U63_01155 [Cyanobacteria bacterium]|jgi:hypothetical protein|nr:hypothetical protein [Cyanobacteriota bacterium]
MPIPLPPWFASTPAQPPSQWLLPAPLFRLLLLGGLVGLVLATLVIVAIWLVEWRRGQVW